MGPNSIANRTESIRISWWTLRLFLNKSCGRLCWKWTSQRYSFKFEIKNTKTQRKMRRERKIIVKNQQKKVRKIKKKTRTAIRQWR
mgnify:CR=1 FL=1